MVEESKVQEGEDIGTFLMGKFGTEKALKSVDEYAAKQSGRYRFQDGKQDLLVVKAPVAVRNDKFSFSGGVGYICKLKEVDVLGSVSPAEQSAILTEVQLMELLGQVKASIAGWSLLYDPKASIMEGITITADTNTYTDKESNEERTKTRFSIVRNEVYNRKLIEANEMATKYQSTRQNVPVTSTATAGNAYTV